MIYSRVIIILLVSLTGSVCTGKSSHKNKNSEKQISETNKEIQWVYSLSKGLELAKKGKKPLMVDFYADWCGWCKKLDKDTYSNSELIKLSTKFISVKVNTDKDFQDARKYKVRGLPTIIFLKSDGEIINKVIGYRDKEYFIKIMKEVIKNH